MGRISRRSFIERTGALAAATTLPTLKLGGAAQQVDDQPADPTPRTRISLRVNGETHDLEVEDRWTLAEVLRDHLGLTGTKVGCDRGECGACTVRLDSTTVYACSQLAVWADGREVFTVEGLADGNQLNLLQQRFVEHDGPQCGFCTAGQLMSASALLDDTPNPTRDQVREGLVGNICRCSNYNRYVEAVLDGTAPDSPSTRALTAVGTLTPRIDAPERVTGRARYTGDVQLPGMLYARVLRSPHPHARVRRVDTRAAERLGGVRAVISRDTCDVIWTSGDSRNDRFLFNNPVRFVGDPVAAVAAVDRHTAEEALEAIVVDYEPLDFVLDAEEALHPGAVEIQPGGNLSPRGRGVREPEVYERGNLDAGFAASDVVLEDAFTSKHINNAQLEPRVSVARWDGDRLTVWTPTQGISNCQRDLARDLDLPPADVRVVCEYMGGGFGNKNQCQDSDLIAAVLARETGSAVKLEYTRKEDFLGVHGRWPTRQYYRVGATRDGTLQAIELRGYSGLGPHRKSSGGIAGIELFRCPNVRRVVHPTYTNMTVSANFRGPSYPQGVWGIESMMDQMAHELEIDPVAFHLKNVSRAYMDETPYTSWALAECIERGAEIFDWASRWRRAGVGETAVRRGVGMATGAFSARTGRSSALLRLDGAGQLWVHVGVTDIGTAAKTTMALLAAEAMEMRLADVRVVWGDTDRCPYSVGESGSRTTVQTGDAILAAAADLTQQLSVRGPPRGDAVLVAEATTNPRIEGMARYASAAHFVEIEADMAVGHVRVVRYVAVHESGRILNPLTAASQVKGGVTIGIGMALHEELLYDRATGVPVNPGYYGVRVMTHLDTPEIEVHFVEPEDAYGPYGAKAIGEPPIIPVVAAIGNAIFNATGRRLHELPFSRDRILEALA